MSDLKDSKKQDSENWNEPKISILPKNDNRGQCVYRITSLGSKTFEKEHSCFTVSQLEDSMEGIFRELENNDSKWMNEDELIEIFKQSVQRKKEFKDPLNPDRVAAHQESAKLHQYIVEHMDFLLSHMLELKYICSYYQKLDSKTD